MHPSWASRRTCARSTLSSNKNSSRQTSRLILRSLTPQCDRRSLRLRSHNRSHRRLRRMWQRLRERLRPSPLILGTPVLRKLSYVVLRTRCFKFVSVVLPIQANSPSRSFRNVCRFVRNNVNRCKSETMSKGQENIGSHLTCVSHSNHVGRL